MHLTGCVCSSEPVQTHACACTTVCGSCIQRLLMSALAGSVCRDNPHVQVDFRRNEIKAHQQLVNNQAILAHTMTVKGQCVSVCRWASGGAEVKARQLLVNNQLPSCVKGACRCRPRSCSTCLCIMSTTLQSHVQLPTSSRASWSRAPGDTAQLLHLCACCMLRPDCQSPYSVPPR